MQYGGAGNRLVLASALTAKPIDGTTAIPLSDTYSYAFAPDGKTFLTGSYDNTARLWDAANGQEVRRFMVQDCERRAP